MGPIEFLDLMEIIDLLLGQDFLQPALEGLLS